MLIMEDIIVSRSLTIPAKELHFSACRSSGPGGQHVNTTSSQVILRFDVSSSPSLSDYQRQKIMTELSRYIDKDGVLSLRCSESRSQLNNKKACCERFANLVRTALIPPKVRHSTRPTKASKTRRLQAKKHRSDIKNKRGKVSRDD